MADQELTALKIRIEAEVANAVKQLESLAATVQTVEGKVLGSVKNINTALSSINAKFKIEVDASGFGSIPAKAKEGVEQARRNIRALTDITLDKIPVGFRVSLDDLLSAKRELEKQRLTVESDVDLVIFNNKIAQLDAEIKRRRSILVTGDVDLTSTITKLKEQLNDLQAQRAIVSVSADATGLDKLDDQIGFIQARLGALDAIEIDPRVNRQSLDAFVAGVKNGFDVTAAELVAFKSKADSLLNFAIGIDKSDLNNISTYLGDQIRKAEAVSEIKLQIDQGNANAIFESIKSGAERSVPVVKELGKVLRELQARYKIEFGLDSAQYKDVSDKLQFIDGQKKILEREVTIRFNSNAVTELRTNLNNLPKSVVLNAVASFNGQQFNDLLNDIKNKNVNLTVTDIADQLKAQIAEIQALNPTLDIDADTAKYDSKVATLKGKLSQVEAIQVNANTAPAEVSIKQLVARAQTILAKQAEINIKAQIQLPSGELAQLQATKKRLEAQAFKLRGTADFSKVYGDLDAVNRRIAELNKQGVKLQVSTGEIISQGAVDRAKITADLIKRIKTDGSNLRVDINSSGFSAINVQATQTLRNFEQIIRDTPSFAISAQQGFIAISNNIGPLTDSFGRLATEAKVSGQSIGTALAGQLKGWNAIGIGISLAVTAIAIFGKEIFGATKDAEKLKTLFDDIKATLDQTKFVVPVAQVSQAGEEAKVRGLTKALTEGKLSAEEQTNALKFLKNLNAEIFGGFADGTARIEGLNAATQKYVQTLNNQSVEEGRIAQVNKLKENQAKVDTEIVEAQRNIIKFEKQYNKDLQAAQLQRDNIQNSTTPFVPIVVDGTKLNAERNKLKDLLIFQKKLIVDAENLSQDIQIESILNVETKVVDASGGKTDDTLKSLLESRKRVLESELKNLNNLSKRYFEIETEIAGLNLQIDNIGEVNSEIKLNNFKEYKNTLRGISIEAVKAGVELRNLVLILSDPTFFSAVNIKPFADVRDDAIKTRQEIESLFRSGAIDVDQKIELKAAAEFKADQEVLKIQKELDSYQLLIKTGIAPQLAPVVPDQSIDPLPDMTDDAQMLKDMGYGLEDWNQKLRNSLKPMEDFQKALEELSKEIANIIASGVADLFGNLFDALNEDGKLTFEEIGKAVNDFVKDLIKAIGKLLIFKAIISAFGLDSVAAIAGPLVRARKFATGGVVTGPTFGMVGEAGPEAVLPLSFLNNLLTDVGGSANLQARVSGQDLLFVMERAGRVNNRTF
jgi:hypothetical protein